MKLQRLLLGFVISGALPLAAQDLPLPVADPYAYPVYESDGTLKPTMVIKPPGSGPIQVPANDAQRQQELAILELERQLVEQQVRRQIAAAHQQGDASQLKRLIVLNGPMDASVSRAAKPPVESQNNQKVVLLGLSDAEVAKSVESFFGAPLTPESEKAILETVKAQLAEGTEGGKPMQVRVAGWWPEEGVMAVSVVSGASGS